MKNKFEILQNENVGSIDSVQTVSKRIPRKISKNRLACNVHKGKTGNVDYTAYENNVNKKVACPKRVSHRMHSPSVNKEVACRNHVLSGLGCTRGTNVNSEKVLTTAVSDECKCIVKLMQNFSNRIM